MTLMQGQVAAEMRGRVSSSSHVFYASAAMLLIIAVVGTIRLARLG
jgi:hypothetical protein